MIQNESSTKNMSWKWWSFFFFWLDFCVYNGSEQEGDEDSRAWKEKWGVWKWIGHAMFFHFLGGIHQAGGCSLRVMSCPTKVVRKVIHRVLLGHDQNPCKCPTISITENCRKANISILPLININRPDVLLNHLFNAKTYHYQGAVNQTATNLLSL